MWTPWTPAPRHDALLRAALLPLEQAEPAWLEWKAAGGLHEPDLPAQRIVPLLYRNLVDAGVDDPALAALKADYLHTWGQGEGVRKRALPYLDTLRERGIDALVLKGVALVELVYGGDLGLRPVGDVDVLVRDGQTDAALGVLRELGWRDVYGAPRRIPHLRQVVHSCGFESDEGGKVDLHWRLLLGCCWPGADDPFWADSVAFDAPGLRARTLCPTDHLFQACAHGLQSEIHDDAPLLQWAADAVAILRAPSTKVDWDRLVALTRDRRFGVFLGPALGYLRERLSAPVPEEVLKAIAEAPPSAAERIDRATRRVGETRPRRLLNFVSLYLRLRRNPRFRPAFLGWGRFLKDSWGLDRAGEVPGLLLRKLGRNLAQLMWLVWRRAATTVGISLGSGPSSSQ